MKQFYLHIILLLSLPILCAGQNAQGSFNTTLDTSKMLIGDHNQLQLQWKDSTVLKNFNINYEAWDTLSSIELLNEEPIVHQQEKGLHIYTKKIRFTSFDSGQVALPPLEIQWMRQGQEIKNTTPPFRIAVFLPDLADDEVLSPIKPIEKEPLLWQDYDEYIYIALGILLLVVLLYFWLKSRKRVPEETTFEREIDPHEQAFIKLQALEHKKLLEVRKFDEFQVELTHIIREFLSRKYHIRALESTSREVVNKLEDTSFPSYKIPVLKELLNMADLVKFAKAEKPGDFHKRMLLEAKEIVKLTNDLRR